MRILHISDFHLENPKEESCMLRKDHSDSYIDGLFDCIQETLGATNIDIMVITGDFIHKGYAAGFAQAHKVIEYISSKGNIGSGCVCPCIGNHDLILDAKKKEKSDSRKAYNKFAKEISVGPTHPKNELYSIRKIEGDVWLVSIDSTLHRRNYDRPGNLTVAEIDGLVSKITKSVPNNQLLIIGSHYPSELFPGRIDQSLVDKWLLRHSWTSAAPLRFQLVDYSRHRTAPTLWLCGDIHTSASYQVIGNYFISAGRFGSCTKTGIPGQARLIEYAPGKDVDVYNFEVRPTAARVGKHDKQWRSEKLPLPQYSGPVFVLPKKEPVAKIELLDPELQEHVEKVIRDKKLYYFGRFDSSEELVSLSWVSIGPLMNDLNKLPWIVRAMDEWLTKKATIDGQPNRILFIGVDCWGAVLASQLSAYTGAKCYPFAARGRGAHHIEYEKLDTDLIDAVKSATAIVLITDVVSTGQSLLHIHRQIEEIEGVRGTKIWYALSIIADEKQERGQICSFLKAHGTVCLSIRMPIVRKDSLPDYEYLPPRLSFK